MSRIAASSGCHPEEGSARPPRSPAHAARRAGAPLACRHTNRRAALPGPSSSTPQCNPSHGTYGGARRRRETTSRSRRCGAPRGLNRHPQRCAGPDPSPSATAARTRCSSRAEPMSRSRGVRLTAVVRSSRARFCSSAPRRSTGFRSPDAAPSHASSASSTRPQSGFLCSRTSTAACAVSASKASATRSASGWNGCRPVGHGSP